MFSLDLDGKVWLTVTLNNPCAAISALVLTIQGRVCKTITIFLACLKGYYYYYYYYYYFYYYYYYYYYYY